MQDLALRPLPSRLPPPPCRAAPDLLDDRRCSALVLFDPTDSAEQLEPTDGSSRGEGVLSLRKLDPHGSNFGPAWVQDFACVCEFLRRRYPTKTAFCVAADTGLTSDAVRKWFFRKPQREPNFNSRQRIARAYGAALAAEAGLPLAVWREAFLYPDAIRSAA